MAEEEEKEGGGGGGGGGGEEEEEDSVKHDHCHRVVSDEALYSESKSPDAKRYSLCPA